MHLSLQLQTISTSRKLHRRDAKINRINVAQLDLAEYIFDSFGPKKSNAAESGNSEVGSGSKQHPWEKWKWAGGWRAAAALDLVRKFHRFVSQFSLFGWGSCCSRFGEKISSNFSSSLRKRTAAGLNL